LTPHHRRDFPHVRFGANSGQNRLVAGHELHPRHFYTHSHSVVYRLRWCDYSNTKTENKKLNHSHEPILTPAGT
jgi:hypothetical protein